jgi:nucleoside-diphosphate-sugar epimerase
LLDGGHDVICLDNLVTGRRTNIEPLMERPGFRFVEHDLIAGLPPLPAIAGIFHLASPASPPGYQHHPLETLRVNSEGTRHLLELASQQGASFLYASTSEVYGDPLEHPQRESYRGNVSSTGPRSMYDEAKRYGEALVVAYTRVSDVNARIVRIFNTYGPHSDPFDGRLVPNFITQALRGDPMTIYGDGHQTRSLCYVDDLVSGMLAAAECEGLRGTATNLGNPEEHTVLEIASLIRELTRSTSEFVYTDPAVGDDPQRRRPDIGRAQSILGWSPKVGLRDGLSRTIAYFEGEIAAGPAWLREARAPGVPLS